MTDAPVTDVTDIEPETVTPDNVDIDLVRDGFSDEDLLVRAQAARVTGTLATQDAEAVRPLIEPLVNSLNADRVTILKEATAALTVVADEYPAELEAAVGPLVELLNHDVPLVRTHASLAVRPLAVHEPEWFLEHVDTMVSVLRRTPTDPAEEIDFEIGDNRERLENYRSIGQDHRRQHHVAQGIVGNVLVEVSRIDSGTLLSYTDTLIELLQDDDGIVVGPAVEIVSQIADDHPGAVDDAVEPLIDRLDVDSDQIRARIVMALGFIGDADAIVPLRNLARDEEAADDLRELATETADWLAKQTEDGGQ